MFYETGHNSINYFFTELPDGSFEDKNHYMIIETTKQ